MELGDGLLATGAVCSVVAALLLMPSASRLVSRAATVPKALTLASFAFLTCALSLLATSFLSSDFAYRYVWEHSSRSLDTVYKVSSIWAGGSGAVLLCAWLVSLVLAIETYARKALRGLTDRFSKVFLVAMSIMVAFFSLSALSSGLFERTDAASLAAYPDGRGLDILLQTPEMVVHAPLILGSYAALCVVFASSASFHITGDRRWHRVGLPWGRLGWLMLTAGIVTGAFWAYYVIGWGGYWSWDPVETASLVPWLMLTAFLHTQDRNLRKGEYPVASPMFGMLSLAGVVFVSFVVRAGGLWRSSVHDYGVSSGSSAVTRLAGLLQDDASVAATFVFMSSLLTVTAYLSVRAHRTGPAPVQPRAPKRLSGYISDQNNMALAVALMSLAALVAVALMFKNVESDQAAMAGELGQKMTVVAAALMISMGLCLVWRDLGRDRALVVSVVLVGVSVSLAIASAITGAFDAVVALALPSCCYAILASSARIAKAVARGHVRTRAFRAGAQLAHFGTAILLVAFVASSNLQSYPSEGPEVAVHVGAQVSVGDYVVRLVSLGVLDDTSDYPAEVAQVRFALVDVLEGGTVVADDARLEVLYGYSPASGYFVLERVANVESSLTEDLYLSFEWMSEDVALVHAKVVPMMLPLWVGCALMVAGLSVRLWTFGPRQEPKEAGA